MLFILRLTQDWQCPIKQENVSSIEEDSSYIGVSDTAMRLRVLQSSRCLCKTEGHIKPHLCMDAQDTETMQGANPFTLAESQA